MSYRYDGRVRELSRLLVLGVLLAARAEVAAAPGDPIGPQFQVNTFTTGNQFFPDVAPDGAGGFVVVWFSPGSSGTDTSNTSVQGQRFDAAGAPVGGEFQVNTYTTSYQFVPRVGPDGAGGFVVVWMSRGSPADDDQLHSIQAQRYDATGSPLGGQFQVNIYTTGNQMEPAVGPDPDGGFVVAWASYGGFGTDTDVQSIQARRYDAAGMGLGGQFQVNTNTTSFQVQPSVGADGGGGFVVAWRSASGGTTDTGISIQAQHFDATGAPVGAEFQVNAYTTGGQGTPGVGADGAGGFVVVWDSMGSDGTDTSGYSLRARRFDSGGLPLGSEFQVNTFTTAAQRDGQVHPDGDGFAVTWSSQGGGGTDPGGAVLGQRFDADGPVGGEFQVNTYTTGSQGGPAIASDGAGGFVVAWNSSMGDGTDPGYSIQAQRFEGTPTTTSTSTTTTSSTSTTVPPTVDTSITGRKLVIIDKTATPPALSKLVSVSKLDAGIQKGAPLAGGVVVPPGLSGSLDVSYTGCGAAAVLPEDPCAGSVPVAGQFVIPDPWLVNKPAVAKYVNRDAPSGGHVKVAVVKPQVVAKVVAKGLGDGPAMDLLAGGKPDAGGVLVVLTVVNALDGDTYRMCTRYEQSAVTFKAIVGGAARKLLARGGVPAACP